MHFVGTNTFLQFRAVNNILHNIVKNITHVTILITLNSSPKKKQI